MKPTATVLTLCIWLVACAPAAETDARLRRASAPITDSQLFSHALACVPGRIVGARVEGRVIRFRIVSERSAIADVFVDRDTGSIVSCSGADCCGPERWPFTGTPEEPSCTGGIVPRRCLDAGPGSAEPTGGWSGTTSMADAGAEPWGRWDPSAPDAGPGGDPWGGWYPSPDAGPGGDPWGGWYPSPDAGPEGDPWGGWYSSPDSGPGEDPWAWSD